MIIGPPVFERVQFLQQVNQEEIMSKYIGQSVSQCLVSNKRICNPFRRDRYPDCAFSYTTDGVLLFTDFAQGQYSGDCIKIVGLALGTDNPEIIHETIQREQSLLSSSIVPYIQPTRKKTTLLTPIETEHCELTLQEYLWWEAGGVSKTQLVKFHVDRVKKAYINGELYYRYCVLPCYDYQWTDPSMHTLYKPKSTKQFKFRSNVRREDMKRFILYGWEQLPANGEISFITSSNKDCMVLDHLDYPAIAFNSEIVPFTEIIQILQNRFKTVYLFYNNDIPGIQNTTSFVTKFNLPALCLPPGPKDPFDFVKKYGLKELDRWIKQQLDQKPELLFQRNYVF